MGKVRDFKSGVRNGSQACKRKKCKSRSKGAWPTHPSPPIDNIWVMVIVWSLRGNIIRTALCWIVWHNVHSLQHTYLSSSYRSNRLGLSHWDPYAVCRGSRLELYYCNTMEWFWWDSSLIFDDQVVSFSALTLLVGHLAYKNRPRNDLLCVEWDVKPYTLTLTSRDLPGTFIILGPPVYLWNVHS